MHRYILKSVAMSVLFLLLAPSAAYLQENANIIHSKKEVIIAVKFGQKNGEFGYDESGGFFTAPKAFAFDSDKNVYITDSAHQKIPRVQEFNSRGEFVRKINVESRNHAIVDIAIHNNNLYVLTSMENIQVFSLSGQHIRTIKYVLNYDVKEEWTAALYEATRLEIDTKGNLYQSTRFGALVKLSPEGAILQKWSKVDHYLDSDGNLFITDWMKNGKVIKYDADGKKLAESTCEAMFAAPPNQECRMPTFIDKKGRMYRIFSGSFNPNTIVTRYTKQQSTLLGVTLYSDEDGFYYKVDGDGNIYTIQIKKDLIKYVSPE
jgi:outer membrane protein assembly factor BamB